jgi:hypothetical protein
VDVHIGELHSTVRTTDDRGTLSAARLAELVAETLAQLQLLDAHRRRAEDERRLVPEDDRERVRK